MKLGVCYYPEQCSKELWEKDAKEMVQMGIQVVRIAEFSWALLEPTENNYQFEWLDEIIDILGKEGLEIVLGTPTAAPPKWLVDKYPEILPYDINGKQRRFGSRRHYSFSSETYQNECKRIVTKLAERYGKNKFIKGWQIDNEYGDHDTALSFGEVDRLKFRKWLQKRYKDINALNKSWGCIFWSMMYNNFDQIDLPNEGIEEPSPTAWLDYYRFSSDNIIEFNQIQVDILKKYSPDCYTLHNYMSNTTEFDHYEIGKSLDIAAFDSYPLGGLVHGWFDEKEKDKFLRTGKPDILSFYHDLYRRVGNGNLWIMEQQPGPVNWARYNTAPLDGMVRLWTMEAFANGADVVAYFRWRQVRYAQEQFHTALKLPNGQLDQAGKEAKQVFEEIKKIPKQKKKKADVALIHDYNSLWALQSLPQGETFRNPIRYSIEQYSALRSIGVDVDVISSNDDISSYKLLIIANCIVENTNLIEQLSQFDGYVFVMGRTFSKTPDMWIPENLPIASLRSVIDIQVNRVESLPEYHQEEVLWKGNKYQTKYWRESVESTQAKAVATFSGSYRNGYPALLEQNKVMYCACWPDKKFMRDIMIEMCEKADISIHLDLEDTRLTKLGNLVFAFNYGNQSKRLEIPKQAKIILGNAELKPAEICIWENSK